MKYKDAILKVLQADVRREGSGEYINMLKKTDFFVAPASTKYHLNYDEGLSEHSWGVLEIYTMLWRYFGLDDPEHPNHIPYESVVLESIGHDNCKIGIYTKSLIGNPATNPQLYRLNKDISKNITRVVETEVLKDTSILNKKGEVEQINFKYASELIDWLTNQPKEEPPIYKIQWDKNNKFPVGHGEKSIMVMQRFIKLKRREMLAIRWHMGAFEDGIYGGKKSWDYNDACKLFPDVKLLHLADNLSATKEEWGL